MATNPYYQRVFSAIAGSLARARALLNEFQLIQAGFDKIGNIEATKEYSLACSDLSTALVATSYAGYFENAQPLVITGVWATVSVPSTSGAVEVAVSANGTPLLSTNITIDANENSSSTASVQPELAITQVAAHTRFEIEIVDGGTGAKGLIFTLLGRITT
jgi:hypothetical protein